MERVFDCHICRGTGEITVPGILNGKGVIKKKPCPKCLGKGKLYIVDDNKR